MMDRIWIPLAVALPVVGGLLTVVGSTYNSLNAQEFAVQAAYRDSQVWYDKFWKSVQEQAQVTDKYAADFRDVFLSSVGRRYDGKDPAMSLIMEANPGLDAALYTRVQDTIETGRLDFAETQRAIVDRQRSYATILNSVTGRLLAPTLGFPRVLHGADAPPADRDADGVLTALDYGIVTSTTTTDAFRTGEAAPLDVFGEGQ